MPQCIRQLTYLKAISNRELNPLLCLVLLAVQVRLYNVNESESLGPYMARYLGAKFYRGEQYYLQVVQLVKDLYLVIVNDVYRESF